MREGMVVGKSVVARSTLTDRLAHKRNPKLEGNSPINQSPHPFLFLSSKSSLAPFLLLSLQFSLSFTVAPMTNCVISSQPFLRILFMSFDLIDRVHRVSPVEFCTSTFSSNRKHVFGIVCLSKQTKNWKKNNRKVKVNKVTKSYCACSDDECTTTAAHQVQRLRHAATDGYEQLNDYTVESNAVSHLLSRFLSHSFSPGNQDFFLRIKKKSHIGLALHTPSIQKKREKKNNFFPNRIGT